MRWLSGSLRLLLRPLDLKPSLSLLLSSSRNSAVCCPYQSAEVESEHSRVIKNFNQETTNRLQIRLRSASSNLNGPQLCTLCSDISTVNIRYLGIWKGLHAERSYDSSVKVAFLKPFVAYVNRRFVKHNALAIDDLVVNQFERYSHFFIFQVRAVKFVPYDTKDDADNRPEDVTEKRCPVSLLWLERWRRQGAAALLFPSRAFLGHVGSPSSSAQIGTGPRVRQRCAVGFQAARSESRPQSFLIQAHAAGRRVSRPKE